MKNLSMVDRRACLLLVIAVLLGMLPAVRAQPATALIGGTAINPVEGTRMAEATVLVKDGHIVAVGPADEVDVPDGARRVDVEGQYVMPGLIDGHVHFFQSGGLYTRPDVIDLRGQRSYAEERDRIEARLSETFRRYLASGITSVVDVGGPMWNLEVREQAQAQEAAPRVVIAGPLLSTWQPPELDVDDPPILDVEQPERAREIVRAQVEAGVDLIKIWYIVRQGETPEEHLPMVRATIAEAHAAGLPVAVHATQLETARAAVEAGADILVHSVFDAPVDEAFVQLLLENDVVYTPTLMVRKRYGEVLTQQLDLTETERHLADPDVLATLDDLSEMPADSLPERVRRGLEAQPSVGPSETAMKNLKVLHEAGVTIAAGTDAGNIGTPHGPSLFYELQLMQQAGLTPMEVLQTATHGGATLMGRAESLGRLESGARADLVVLRKDPLESLSNVATADRVMRGGRLFEPEALLDVTTSRQQQ